MLLKLLSSRNKDVFDGILFMVFSVFILIVSSGMDGFGDTILSPGTFPFLGGTVLFFLALGLLLKNFRLGESSFTEKTAGDTKWVPVFAVTLICLLYVWFLPVFHFVISTIVFLALFLWYIGERRIWMVGAVSVLTTMIIYFIFGHMLKVLLP